MSFNGVAICALFSLFRNHLKLRNMPTATPETDAKIFLMLSALQSGTQEVVSADHARNLEIERDSARRVLEHCRLFILKRLGYHATEEMERSAIGAAIEAILSENAEAMRGGADA